MSEFKDGEYKLEAAYAAATTDTNKGDGMSIKYRVFDGEFTGKEFWVNYKLKFDGSWKAIRILADKIGYKKELVQTDLATVNDLCKELQGKKLLADLKLKTWTAPDGKVVIFNNVYAKQLLNHMGLVNHADKIVNNTAPSINFDEEISF